MTEQRKKRSADDSAVMRRVVFRVYKELDPEFFAWASSFSNSALNKLAQSLLQSHWQQLNATQGGTVPSRASPMPVAAVPAPFTADAQPVAAPTQVPPVAVPAPAASAPPERPIVQPAPAPQAKAPAQPSREQVTTTQAPAPSASAQSPAQPAPAPAAAPPAAEPAAIELGPMVAPAAPKRPVGPNGMTSERRQAWLRAGE